MKYCLCFSASLTPALMKNRKKPNMGKEEERREEKRLGIKKVERFLLLFCFKVFVFKKRFLFLEEVSEKHPAVASLTTFANARFCSILLKLVFFQSPTNAYLPAETHFHAFTEAEPGKRALEPTLRSVHCKNVSKSTAVGLFTAHMHRVSSG